MSDARRLELHVRLALPLIAAALVLVVAVGWLSSVSLAVLFAFVGAIAVGYFMRDAARVTAPMLEARVAMRALEDGHVPLDLKPSNTKEMAELSESVNSLARAFVRKEDSRRRERLEFRTALDTISSTIANAPDPAALYTLTVSEGVRILRFPAAAAFVPLPDGSLTAVAVAGESAPCALGDLVDGGDASPVALAAREARVTSGRGDDARDVLAVPIVVDGRVDGVIALYDQRGSERVRPEEAQAVSILARQAAIAIENMRMHEEARRDRERYRAVVENAGDGIIVRRGAEVVFANAAMQEKLGGFDLPIAVSAFFERFVHPEDQEIIRSYYERRIEGDRSRMHYELRFLRPEGGVFHGAVLASPVTYDGSEASLIFVRDVSGLKHAESELRDRTAQLVQAEKLAAIGMLAASVAHEINNPLAFLRGNIEILQQDIATLRADLPPERQKLMDEWDETLRVNLTGLDRIAVIVRSLRQFAKPAHDKKEVHLNDVVEMAITLASGRLRGRRISLVRDLAPALPAVRASETQIGQIALNLIVNAADALGDRGGEIVVRTHDEGGIAVLEVSDNGPGIPRDMEERLFDAFATTKDSGMGLGLSISRQIAREHGGDLTYSAREGGGAVFRVLLAPDGETSSAVATSGPVTMTLAPSIARVKAQDDAGEASARAAEAAALGVHADPSTLHD